jgi:hypothetical protein
MVRPFRLRPYDWFLVAADAAPRGSTHGPPRVMIVGMAGLMASALPGPGRRPAARAEPR